MTPATVLMMISLVRSYTQQPPRKILNKELGMGKGKDQGSGLRSSTFSVLIGSIGKGMGQGTRSKTKEIIAIQGSIILNLETVQGSWQWQYDAHEYNTCDRTIEQVLEQWN